MSLPQPKVVEVRLCSRPSEDERALAQLAGVARAVLGDERLESVWPDATGVGQGVPGGATAEDLEAGNAVLREVRGVLAEFFRRRRQIRSDSGVCAGSRVCVAECLR